MAFWSTPVTDREPGARMTHIDMNRITNNINYIAEKMAAHSAYFGPTISKTVWEYNDIVTLAEWQEILHVLDRLVRDTAIEINEPGNEDTTYTNMNNVEDITLRLKRREDILVDGGSPPHWVDTEVWTGDDFNVGGLEDPEANPYRRIRHYCDTEVYCGDIANAGGVE